MNLLQKVGKMFGFHARVRNQEATAHAIEKARAVGRQADRVNGILQAYLKSDEPFRAFAVDIFERGQESRIFQDDAARMGQAKKRPPS